ncbi:MAG: RICIN domain-containing protein [Syntrophaceae bacterium]
MTAKHSSKCLDVSGAGRGNDDNVHQWDCHGGDNQLWRLK